VREIALIEECCPPVLEAPLAEDSAARVAGWFKVLADPARLRALSLIAQRGEACNCHLTEPLGLSQPTVSHHLKVLHEAGLLERERRGQWVYYRVVPERLEILRDALDITSRPQPAPRVGAATR
jgi:ArsR family transcriptional regulator, arsenate/arsenite/antimonite-responsive transcriptional repressor